VNPRSILLLRFRRLGDIVLTTPAVSLLKRRFPEASTVYLVEEPYRRLVEGNPDIDRVIIVPVKQNRRDFFRLIREIRKARYDVLLDFHGGPRASWITLLGGAQLKIGHTIKTKGFLYHKTAPRRGAGAPIHSVETHAGLIRALGVDFNKEDIPPLVLPAARPEEIARIDALAAQIIPGEAERQPVPLPLAVLHIGAGNAFRDWGEENAADLAARLLEIPGMAVAAIGGENDRPRESRIAGRLNSPRFFPLCGRLNFIEIRELISRASLFLGPDSGPMHLAASTGTPIVAYFGPTLPALFGPWRPGLDPVKTVILQTDLDCRPCRQHECVTGDYRCLRSITPGDVFAVARPFLPR
jgi:heptosyltransferase-1